MEKDLVLLLVGLIVGVMNAIAGGGMLLGFPALMALGTPALVANAVGNVVTCPGQLASAIGYREYLRRVPKVYVWLLVPIALGAAVGGLALRHTNAYNFERIVPALVLFGVVLFAFQPLLHFHLHRHFNGRAKTSVPVLLLALALLPLSIYGGYFGAGYGIVLLGFLGFTSLRDAHLMNAMKNVAAIVVSGTTILCIYSAHLIDWRIGLITGLGATVGGYVGARSAQKVSSHGLRVCVVVFGLASVAYLGITTY